MLYLSRKVGEVIFIKGTNGDLTKVKLTSINGDCATLGFDAPLSINVVRSEVYFRQEKLNDENIKPTSRDTAGRDTIDNQ